MIQRCGESSRTVTFPCTTMEPWNRLFAQPCLLYRATGQPSTARSGHHISCCLVSLLFLCDILSSHPVVDKKPHLYQRLAQEPQSPKSAESQAGHSAERPRSSAGKLPLIFFPNANKSGVLLPPHSKIPSSWAAAAAAGKVMCMEHVADVVGLKKG